MAQSRTGSRVTERRAVEQAFHRLFAGLCAFPKPRKKFLNDSFMLPAEDVTFRRLTRNYGPIRLPKIGWVRFRGYRALGAG